VIEWNLVSLKRQLFFALIRETYPLQTASLIAVVTNKAHYSPRYRAAALRNLMHAPPLDVTRARSFVERRRIVRHHFGV